MMKPRFFQPRDFLGDGWCERQNDQSGPRASRKNSESGTDKRNRPSSINLAASHREMSSCASESVFTINVRTTNGGNFSPQAIWIQACVSSKWVTVAPPTANPWNGGHPQCLPFP